MRDDPLDVLVLLGDPRLPDETKVGQRYGAEDLLAVERLKAGLEELDGWRWRYLDDHSRLLASLLARPPELVLNLCDTGYRNVASRELHVAALLELLEIPASGAGPSCLALCYDKALVRAVADAHGITVPLETYVAPGADLRAVAAPALPAIVKPNPGDGSLGIDRHAVVRTDDEVRERLAWLRRELPGRGAVVQEFLEGTEYGVGLTGNPGAGWTVLPVLEVDYDALDPALPRILAYESKAVPDSPYWTRVAYREARAPDAVQERMIAASRALFERLECRDYARFDFRAGADGAPRLLEVNPNPAWCWDGKLNLMAGLAGHRYPDFLRLILEAATVRAGARIPATPL